MYWNVHEKDKGYSLQRTQLGKCCSRALFDLNQHCQSPGMAGSPRALCLIVQSTFLPQELLQGVTVFKDVLVGNTSLFGTPFHSSFSSSLLSSIPSHISTLKCIRIHFFA